MKISTGSCGKPVENLYLDSGSLLVERFAQDECKISTGACGNLLTLLRERQLTGHRFSTGGQNMALKVKAAGDAAQRFVDNGAAAGKQYEQGVTGAGQDWQAGASAAKQTYADGVQDAISRDAYSKGIQAAGASKYERKAREVGVARFPQGVRAAKSDYQQNVEPYLETLRGLSLSPRRPAGDPQNFNRVQEVGLALRRRKIAG